MFSKYYDFQTKLISYLSSLNENINWDELIINTIQKSKNNTTDTNTNSFNELDIKILNLIRNRLWTDKNISGIDKLLKIEFLDYFIYYNKLLTIYSEILKNNEILILDINPKNNILEELTNDIKLKISILKTILDLRKIKYKCIYDSEETYNKPIICTASITYKHLNPRNKYIIDNYDNLYFKETNSNKSIGSKNLCLIKLIVKSMLLTNLDVKEIINKEFNIFELKETVIK